MKAFPSVLTRRHPLSHSVSRAIALAADAVWYNEPGARASLDAAIVAAAVESPATAEELRAVKLPWAP